MTRKQINAAIKANRNARKALIDSIYTLPMDRLEVELPAIEARITELENESNALHKMW